MELASFMYLPLQKYLANRATTKPVSIKGEWLHTINGENTLVSIQVPF